jgi:hypothetical protein
MGAEALCIEKIILSPVADLDLSSIINQESIA